MPSFVVFISPRIWTCASKKYLKLNLVFFLQYLELLSLAQETLHQLLLLWEAENIC